MNRISYSIFTALLAGFCLLSCQSNGQETSHSPSPEAVVETNSFWEERQAVYQEQLRVARQFLNQTKSYNQDKVFLIDMRIPSGKYRFFVHNLKTDSIEHRGLVAHGSGSVVSDDSLTFSNIPNSYQTSLGRYRIGVSYKGNFGKSYKLHGLDPTNNKAYDRYVVLHPYSCVPDEEQEYPICESLGCPMVSHHFMETLYEEIDQSDKHLLLIIYY